MINFIEINFQIEIFKLIFYQRPRKFKKIQKFRFKILKNVRKVFRIVQNQQFLAQCIFVG